MRFLAFARKSVYPKILWEDRIYEQKRLIYALFVLLLVPVLSFLYIRRVTYVSQRFVLPKHEIYALHDQVQFGKTYISDPRVEFSDGYSLTVLEANAYTMRLSASHRLHRRSLPRSLLFSGPIQCRYQWIHYFVENNVRKR